MMPSVHLDISTLLASECLICVMFSLILFILAHLLRSMPGTRRLAQAFLASSFGTFIFLISGAMPLAAGVLVANGALLLANLLFYDGVDALLKLRARLIYPGAIALLTLCPLFYYTAIDNRITARIVLLSTADFLMQIWLLIDLNRSLRKGLAVYLLGVFVLISMSADLLRAIAVLFGGAAQNLLQHSVVQASYLVTGVLAACGLGIFSLMLVTGEITRAVERSARSDSLTGALNRRGIEEHLTSELERARRNSTPLCVALLDLDAFKAVNDTWGHAAGDTLLCEITNCITTHLRSYDVCGRMGGDEFLILLPGSDDTVARQVCERILHHVASLRFKAQGGFQPSVSIGYTQFDSTDTQKTLIDRADRALYLAKEEGRNCVRKLLFATRSARNRAYEERAHGRDMTAVASLGQSEELRA